MIIFRLLPAIFLGDGIYGDEQDEFECVGTQPGCRNMCFTEFSPMQPPRMWCLQILLSCVPPVIFNFYAARQTAQETIEIICPASAIFQLLACWFGSLHAVSQ